MGKSCLKWKKRDGLDKRFPFLLSLDTTCEHNMLRDGAIWEYTRKTNRNLLRTLHFEFLNHSQNDHSLRVKCVGWDGCGEKEIHI